MFAQRALRRPGIGLVGATVIGDSAYAAGSSSATQSEHEAGQNQDFAPLNAQPLADAIISAEPSVSSSVLSHEKMAQIRELGEMKKEGLLTYMEFEAQKQRLLS